MSADSEAKPVLFRFFDNFLQERNIKWLLALGMLILLASSVMLVTTHWGEASYTPFWKYVTLLGYAAGIYLASQWAYHRACLRKTGTVLMALTVLLAPLTFLALRWVQPDVETGFFDQGLNVGLLALNFVLVLVAVDRIFRHFLRGPQLAFTASFLGLCLAGAVLPGIDWNGHPLLAAGAALPLWVLFAVGTIKINRHVFWLAESHETPRVFGFFPMLLLGGQYLLLFALNFAGHIELQWIGLGCVLTAIPILLASDQIAAVFQQRTGNLVRPLPWPIALPFGAGLLLTVVGVCLAGLELRPPHIVPLALVPAAALAAVVLGLVARRTGQQAFVWGMLVLTVLAYNFSYVFFLETARFVIAQGASAVRESRLPLAFYGLTYVPLLLALTASAKIAARRGQPLFAKPIQSFCVALAGVLLVLACSNVKAELPVGIVLLALFAVQSIVFRDRHCVHLGIGAWLVAAFGAAPFCDLVIGRLLPADSQLVILVIAAALLWIPGTLVDRFVRTLPSTANRSKWAESLVWQRPCESASLICSILFALWGIQWFASVGGSPAMWLAAILLIGLQFAHSLRRTQLPLGPFVYSFSVVAAVCFADWLGTVTLPAMISFATWSLLAQWCVTYALASRPTWRVSTAYLPTLHWTSLIGLSTAVVASIDPMVCEACHIPAAALPIECGWLLRGLLMAWTFDAARRFCQPSFAVLGVLAVFAAISSLLVQAYGGSVYLWLPVAWSVTALFGMAVVELLRRRLASLGDDAQSVGRRNQLNAFIVPLEVVFPGIQICIALGTLQLLAWPLRLAAVIALASLLAHARVRRDPLLRYLALAVFNWQALVALTAWLCPRVEFLPFVFLAKQYLVGVPLAFASSVSLLAWHWSRRGQDPVAKLCETQRNLLRVAVVAGLGLSLFAAALTPLYAVLAIATFCVVTLTELLAACEERRESHVWSAEFVVLLGVGYLAYFRELRFGYGWAMFIVLAVGIAVYLAAQVAKRFPRTAILSRPLELTGFWMPLLTVAIGIGRHFYYAEPTWLGMNSLALLLAAAFYFYQALERRVASLWVLSATILNVALVLLWRELHFADPQFYLIPIGISILALVQLLKREIPAQFHDPLRYLGALVILVSPTVHIVGGSWLHMISLLIAAVAIVLVSIGLRVRALMYTGAAFLLADLVTMIVQGSLGHPNLLWIVGLGVGASVVALGAFCENHRELLQQRLRMLSASLKQWD